MKVLVVDDQQADCSAAAHALAQAGYEVRTAIDGREAIEVLAACDCQLVVCNCTTPRISSMELCRAIRSSEHLGYVYLVMLTSDRRREHALEALAAGADDCITIPFDTAELVLRVNTGRRMLALEMRHLIIFALAKLAESRDPETGSHLERVRSYCRALAEHLKTVPKFGGEINDRYVQLIYETSPLHDIGKVHIPDSVLLKPGQLTLSEREIMKTHARHGAETLDAAIRGYPQAAFLQMARDIALTHHEKYDGSGYPCGLSGDRIPLCGRIMAVADVYDALRSKRVYKQVFSHEAARSIILAGSGTHFDPDVVEAFRACEPAFLAICERFADEDATGNSGGAATAKTPALALPARMATPSAGISIGSLCHG